MRVKKWMASSITSPSGTIIAMALTGRPITNSNAATSDTASQFISTAVVGMIACCHASHSSNQTTASISRILLTLASAFHNTIPLATSNTTSPATPSQRVSRGCALIQRTSRLKPCRSL